MPDVCRNNFKFVWNVCCLTWGHWTDVMTSCVNGWRESLCMNYMHAAGQTWIMYVWVYVRASACARHHVNACNPICMYFTHAQISLLFVEKVFLFIFPLFFQPSSSCSISEKCVFSFPKHLSGCFGSEANSISCFCAYVFVRETMAVFIMPPC